MNRLYIQKLQDTRYTEKSGPLFKSLKILNIFELNAYLTAVFVYSHHHDQLPAFWYNRFKTNKSLVYIPTIRDQQRTYILNLEKRNKLWQIFYKF